MKKIILLTLFSCSLIAHTQTLADFYTSMGNFRVELREDLMPITANNFIKLSRKGFYDATIFHRVVADFVIQGGDPIGTGSGGPGYTIMDEDHITMNHDSAGVIGMAKDVAPNSAGSQFYFTLSPQPGLNRRYAVFGACIQGLQVILDIGKVRVNGDDKPLDAVILDSIRIVNTTTISHQEKMRMPLEVYPNPFTERSYIRYEIKRAGPLTLSIYDMQGRLIRTLIDEKTTPGVYDTDWDGRNAKGTSVAQGVYVLVIKGVDGTGMRRLMKF
jgi:cyclophilin family peptidyl-prolyl cis-trans isomerase